MTLGDTQHVDLVRALGSRRGESAARTLYRAYGGELFGFARHRLGDSGLAEEVVQDVFTNAWRHAGDFDGTRGSVRTWLFAIARNAIIDAERHRGRRAPQASYDAPEAASPDDPIERALLGWQVSQAFARLTPEHRDVLQLAHVQGLTLKQIAARSGLPIGTVKSRTYYAVKSLQLALEELGVTP